MLGWMLRDAPAGVRIAAWMIAVCALALGTALLTGAR